MNKIIIVGHPQSGIENVEKLLVASGMAPAQPSRRDGMRPQEIDATLLKAHGATPIESIQNAEQLQQIQVAPVWQGMVLDLMLSNLDQQLWGWADTQAVYLLDYWKEQDPKIVFVLVYDEPHTALTRLSLEEAVASEEELQRRLDAWVAYNSALLHFYLRNPMRSVLLHAQQIKPSATYYLQYLSERVASPLKLTGQELLESALAPDTVSSLLEDAQVEVLISLLMQANPQAQTLYAELQAASTLSSRTKMQGLISLTDSDNAHIRYRAWQACVTQQQHIQTLGQRIQSVSAERVQLQEYLERTQRELDAAYQQAREQQTQYVQALHSAEQTVQVQLNEQAQQLALIQRKQKESEQENSLLLSQLQQVQEELAHYQQANEDKVKIIGNANAELQAKNSELHTKNSELQAKNRQLADIRQQFQVLGETERSAQAALKEQVKETGLIREKLYEQTKQLTQISIQLRQQKQFNENKEKSLRLEFSKENDLLLNQLHQVQEELESYYLENQELKANQKPKAELYFGAAERVKQQLSYRLGARMIERSHSLGGWLSMPFALRAEAKRFRQDRAVLGDEKLPPISEYCDAHEAEHVKKHLSYRLGARMLTNSKSLRGWLTMPWALRAEIKDFKKTRR